MKKLGKKLQWIFNHKFGRLIIIKEAEPRVSKRGYNKRAFLCECDCGNTKTLCLDNLIHGNTNSCGCLHTESAYKAQKIWAKHNLSHKTPLYGVWNGIKNRCLTPTALPYKWYGARGITICNEWKDDFKVFYDWCMANGYGKGLQIDRINNDGNYEPSNCRFVTPKENRRNASTCKLTQEIVDSIRGRYAEGGILQKELAVEYDVSNTVLNKIVLNRIWT